VWDNFPVNDNHPWRLILDPLRGRENALFAAVLGLFSNPMYQAHASMIPLQTVSDFLWNPLAYDARASRIHALISQYGAEAPELFAPLLQIYDDQGEEPLFSGIFDERRSVIDIPAIESGISALDSAIKSMETHAQFQKLTPELEPVPAMLRDQLSRVLASSSFKHRSDGKIEWDRSRHLLAATEVKAPNLDGDFTKWRSRQVQHLQQAAQIESGAEFWTGQEEFSADVAFGWDRENLYVGVDIIDPALYQPFEGRGIQKADAFRLVIDTKNDLKSGRPVGVYDLYFSPGDFSTVHASLFCDEDFFPPRPHPHDYNREIRVVWKKTPAGFSGDIVIPAPFFGRTGFDPGVEIGLSFGARKTLAPQDASSEDIKEIVFTSKSDKLFSVDPENPATLQAMVLRGSELN